MSLTNECDKSNSQSNRNNIRKIIDSCLYEVAIHVAIG